MQQKVVADDNTALPLAGVRILDLTRLLPGPLATLHLADLGADVIKIEDPENGDYARWLGPLKKTQSGFFLAINRNKRSLALNLKTPGGREALLRLVETADAVIEGFRPGVMDKLALDYQSLSTRNPSIVLCSISGYGQDGPWQHRAGHDINYCATSGVLEQTGRRHEPPALGNFQVADIAGGALSATTGMLAALLSVARGGPGRHVDISMTDCALAGNVMAQMELDARGGTRERGDDFLTGRLPNYNVYGTADSRYLAVGALEPVFWRRLCTALDDPQLLETDLEDEEQCEAARERLSGLFSSAPLAHWERLLDGVDCCVCPVLTLAQARDHPQLQSRGMFVTLEHPAEGPVAQFASPFRMSGFEFAQRLPAPSLGEHSREILTELGFASVKIDELCSSAHNS
ncbi:MAG: CoA transferase [Gammaproteobacteria bacterium]|nr:CoA transferase [Gammaproteobacteria bacterium]